MAAPGMSMLPKLPTSDLRNQGQNTSHRSQHNAGVRLMRFGLGRTSVPMQKHCPETSAKAVEQCVEWPEHPRLMPRGAKSVAACDPSCTRSRYPLTSTPINAHQHAHGCCSTTRTSLMLRAGVETRPSYESHKAHARARTYADREYITYR